jgi:hypothetical protein
MLPNRPCGNSLFSPATGSRGCTNFIMGIPKKMPICALQAPLPLKFR